MSGHGDDKVHEAHAGDGKYRDRVEQHFNHPQEVLAVQQRDQRVLRRCSLVEVNMERNAVVMTEKANVFSELLISRRYETVFATMYPWQM